MSSSTGARGGGNTRPTDRTRAISESSCLSSHREMPLVERTAFTAPAFPSTALSGPLFTTMNAKPSSSTTTRFPASPDAVSTLPSGRPPISPPTALPSMPRMAPLPTLVRLPSLTRASLHATPSHRPSVLPTPQAQTHLTPATVPMPPSPPLNAEPPSSRELAARLALLLHARECCTPLDMERTCGVRNCRVARGVLDHCQECFLAEGQCHRSCSEAKQLLRHFRVCRAQHFQRPCAICDLLRSEFGWAMQHARSLTPLFVPRSSSEGQDDTFPPQHEAQRRHSSYHPEPLEHHVPTTSLRRSVSEGPQATMSATGHHKRIATMPPTSSPFEPQTATSGTPTVKRVRIVTPTEQAEAAARGKAL